VLFPAMITNQRWPYFNATGGVSAWRYGPRRDPSGEDSFELTRPSREAAIFR
jgi:hypothetical protein